jgi:Kef-type K+ transport system membrane component KefB/mannitol/fructose-specific phosphotransferase system IIA component (Ntr-type)
MHGNEVLVFLLSLAILLGVARGLGELARAIGLPLVVGEITTGILLGASGLKRVWPSGFAWLFPSGTVANMLSGYTTVSVVLLLVVAGLEVDLGIVRRRGKSAVLVAALGILMPLLGGLVLGYLVPDSVVGAPEHRPLFALFMGVALSISALPVIAKTLLDLGLFKTDIGLLVMTVAMVDDLVGWVAFSLLLGPMHGGGVDFGTLTRTIAGTALFAALVLGPGRPLLNRVLAFLEKQPDLAPGRVLSLLTVLAMLGASFTQAVGIHAVLGGFIVGVAVGDAPRLNERMRHTVHQFVTNIFAPVFFASVALRVDFVASFDALLCLTVFLVATAAKLIGCAGGARLTGLPLRESLAVGFGLNARGAMEIILALLAREAHLIGDRVFVSLVTMAIGTSLLAGPAMKRLLYRGPVLDEVDDAARLVRDGAFVPELVSTTSARAIEELGRALRPAIGDLVEPALISTLEREMVAPTGLGDDVAIPHAAVEGLQRPVVALGLSPRGIDFDAPDGRPCRIVFLLLLPPRAYEKEVRVLAALARSVFDVTARDALLATSTLEAAVECLDKHGRRIGSGKSPGGPRMTSLTDM